MLKRIAAMVVLVAVVLGSSLLSPGIVPVYAENGNWYKCPYHNGQYYRPVFPAFRKGSVQILHESNEKLMLVLEQNIGQLTFLGWSPDCRYLGAAIGPYSDSQIYVWDLTTGSRAGIFPMHGSPAPYVLAWNVSSRYIAVPTRVGTYLWDVQGNRQLQLDSSQCGFGEFLVDETQQQIFLVPVTDVSGNNCFGGDQGVTVYDLRSGRLIDYFGNPGRGYDAHVRLSPDGRQITISAQSGEPLGLTTWDRKTHQILAVTAQLPKSYIQLGPEQHYLAILDGALFIYDLTHPRFNLWRRWWEEADIVPTGDARYTFTFNTSTILEIHYPKPPRTRHYDLLVGKFID